jgi:hypothetical protein
MASRVPSPLDNLTLEKNPMNHRSFHACAAISAAVLACLPGSVSHAGDVQFFGPSPYLCIEDSPFDISGLGVSFFLENVEDGLVNAPGLSTAGANITGPGGITDSVDCDDGLIDNSGVAGKSLFGSGPAGITAMFNSRVLGGFPTSAGMVWTDGGQTNTVTFEAFDAAGVSLGTIVAENIGDGSFNSDCAEDRFFGAFHPGGISKIFMKLIPFGGGSGIEIDHIQYGFAGPVTCIGDADINGDLVVDGADLGLLLGNWDTDACESDINGDGITDGGDLGLLLGEWSA